MLERYGPWNEDALIAALKTYLPLYAKEKEVLEIPWKDNGVVMVAKFQMLVGNWVYLESYKRK